MRIALMTTEESFDHNYGAILQGYALNTVLTSMGNSVEIVRYFGGNPMHSSFHRSLVRYGIRLYKKWFKPLPEGENVQVRRFREFSKNNLSFWNRIPTEWFWLKHIYPEADAYVCGSDQIWNPFHKAGYNDPGYFLDFVPKGKKRIAYAPSFACDDIPTTAQKDIDYYINQFDAVSVREQEGADIIKKYTGRNATVVADPTFLLSKDNWQAIARKPMNLPARYILCYRFKENPFMTECMNELSQKLNCPIVTLPLSKVAKADPYIKRFDVGPAEFIGAIENAELVCTDSFHATAFSITMNTPFFTFLDNDVMGRGTNMNSRMRTVLRLADLESRIIRSKMELQLADPTNVDFSTCNHNIQEYRAQSLKWLKNALEG